MQIVEMLTNPEKIATLKATEGTLTFVLNFLYKLKIIGYMDGTL